MLLDKCIIVSGPLLRFPRESEDYPNSDFSNYTANEGQYNKHHLTRIAN